MKNGFITSLGSLFLPILGIQTIDSKETKESNEKSWANRVDFYVLLCSTLVFTLITLNVSSILQNWDWSNNQCIGTIGRYPFVCTEKAKFWFGILYGQMLVPQIQLMIIIGLCLDNKKSWTGWILRARAFQFLGRISMALYLVHGNVIWFVNIKYPWRDVKRSNSFLKNIGNVPIHVIIALFAATVLTLFVEEPVKRYLTRKFLKANKNE